jgi:hypothetical protein
MTGTRLAAFLALAPSVLFHAGVVGPVSAMVRLVSLAVPSGTTGGCRWLWDVGDLRRLT